MATHNFSSAGWGHRIEIIALEPAGLTLRVAGWCSDNIKVEDYVTLPRDRNSTTRYQVKSITWKLDPPDMFFAELVFAPRPIKENENGNPS